MAQIREIETKSSQYTRQDLSLRYEAINRHRIQTLKKHQFTVLFLVLSDEFYEYLWFIPIFRTSLSFHTRDLLDSS